MAREYRLPYQKEAGCKPTLQKMISVVVRRNCRPQFPSTWKDHSVSFLEVFFGIFFWNTVLRNFWKRWLSVKNKKLSAQKKYNQNYYWRYCSNDIWSQFLKFFIKNFINKCEKIRRFLWIWLHLLKKVSMEKFIFCAVQAETTMSMTTIIWFVCHCANIEKSIYE